MRVGVNSHYRYRRLSGLSRYTRQLFKCLSEDRSIKIHEVGLNRVCGNGSQRNNRLLRFLTTFICELIEPTILLFMGLIDIHISPAFAVPLCLWSRRCIVVVHDLAFIDNPRSYKTIEKIYYSVNMFLLKHSRVRIVAPSQYTRQRICSELSVDESRVTVIYPYSEYFEPRHSGIGGDYFIVVSNGHPRKNLEATVMGYNASTAWSSGLSLLIVGNFESEEIRSLAQKENIKVVSNQSDEELASLYNGCTANLLFSLEEGFGYTIVEASTYGKVSLTSNTSSLVEFAHPQNRDNIKVVSKEAIRSVLDRFLKDKDFRDELQLNLEYVRSKYSLEKFRGDWLRLINNVACS